MANFLSFTNFGSALGVKPMYNLKKSCQSSSSFCSIIQVNGNNCPFIYCVLLSIVICTDTRWKWTLKVLEFSMTSICLALYNCLFGCILQEGVYIFGLYLDGASWDRRNCRLTEAHAKVLFTLLPVVHMYAINSTAPKDPRLYQCPVYKKPNRTDLTYITFMVLKTTQGPDLWTLRGVAALCDIK